MDIATETTRQVIARRRLRTLGQQRERLAWVDTAEGVFTGAGDAALRPADFPECDLRPARPREGPLELDGSVARLALGPATIGRLALEVRLSERVEPDAGLSRLGQTLDRIDARDVERGVSEALQRSLLTHPSRREGLQIAVRYLPATRVAQVGGDWYDAFNGPRGALTLAVGDVTGHDRHAAAVMAQVRNLLRGVAYTGPRSPAQVPGALDEARPRDRRVRDRRARASICCRTTSAATRWGARCSH
jgi:hypothetical protein